MHNMGKTIGEIHAMLIEYEKGLPKKAETPQVMMIKSGKIQKANKKSLNAKGKTKDDACHHCKEVGHWKRNSLCYLAELQKKREASSALPGFRIERKLKQGALYLYVGNGVRAQVEAIGSFDLVLPNGLVICLDNCHYAPTITRGVVSVSHLVDNGFIQCFTDYGISVSKNDVLYFNAISQYAEFFEKRLISQEISGRAVDLEEIQKKKIQHLLKSLATFLKRWRVLNHHKRK
ncbi:retrotransposon protein, putative, ty1-copia subclass [Tanacetum coccineum]|uniref:Retrotransposon protein, putative, ty1-copia subclass n=1 Tax=Tanacetum coccineum TaxID=301880 RepID=A0ABQ5F6S9_9ASTR